MRVQELVEENSLLDRIKVDHQNIFERTMVKSLMQEYTPNKIIYSPVSIIIILDEDDPVYNSPRRTSYANNERKKKIDQRRGKTCFIELRTKSIHFGEVNK